MRRFTIDQGIMHLAGESGYRRPNKLVDPTASAVAPL